MTLALLIDPSITTNTDNGANQMAYAPKSVKLSDHQIEALRQFIATERSGMLSDGEKEALAKLFEMAKAVTIKF